MGYQDGEALLLTQVKNATGFGATNAARGDWKMLDSGESSHYAIIKQSGGTPGDFVTMRIEAAVWRASVQVWMHYKTTSSYTDLLGYVDAIKDRLILYPKLGDTGGTVRDARVVEYSEVQEMWTTSGGLEWLRQDLIVEWTEETNVTFSE